MTRIIGDTPSRTAPTRPRAASLAGRLWLGIAAAGFAGVVAACGSAPQQGAAGTTTTTSSTIAPSTTAVSTSTTPASTSTSVGTGSAFDSCSVVTQSEASAALGEQVTAGILGSATVEGGLACVFYGPSAPLPHDPAVAQADSVRVVVVKGANARAWYEDYKSRVHAQPVAGYGDEAYYDGYASLSILKGDSYLRLAVAPANSAPSLSAEERLAAAVLPNL